MGHAPSDVPSLAPLEAPSEASSTTPKEPQLGAFQHPGASKCTRMGMGTWQPTNEDVYVSSANFDYVRLWCSLWHFLGVFAVVQVAKSQVSLRLLGNEEVHDDITGCRWHRVFERIPAHLRPCNL